jgi:hypothetical protein
MILTELSAPETEVEIVWGLPGHKQKLIRAKVQKAPYKPERAR